MQCRSCYGANFTPAWPPWARVAGTILHGLGSFDKSPPNRPELMGETAPTLQQYTLQDLNSAQGLSHPMADLLTPCQPYGTTRDFHMPANGHNYRA